MKKIKNWFFNRFLPLCAKESVLKDMRKTQEENEELRNKIAELEAYIHGLHAGMKSMRRVVVNAGEVVKK
jgi:cell division protein FtsB